ncbi:MAG: hypothetical protein WC023_01570 [Rhodocyclaceae bacterium]
MTASHEAPAIEVIDYSQLPEPWEPRTLTRLRRRIDACLNACEGFTTEALEANAASHPIFTLRDALRERNEYRERSTDAKYRLARCGKQIAVLLAAVQEARRQLDNNELAFAAWTLDAVIAKTTEANPLFNGAPDGQP